MQNTELRHIDRHFSKFMARILPGCSEGLIEAIGELSFALSRQHSCLDLAGRSDGEQLSTELLARSFTEGNNVPIILHGEKLYLSRYYYYEKSIAEKLTTCNRVADIADRQMLSEFLKPDGTDGSATNWQQVATLQALTRNLTIITGGPGTGKTTTIGGIIAHLNTLSPQPLKIRLAAPTGKAAMRLRQSLTSQVADGTSSLPVQTLHRLLGVRRDGRSFRFHADNPLDADVLVIDEASMIDLPMMYRILAALPDSCRLIMVGDPDQLPSVETGNVLRDLCTPRAGYSETFCSLTTELLNTDLPVNPSPHPLDDVVCRLQVSHRFSPDEGIGLLSRRVTEYDPLLPDNDSGLTVLDPAELQSADRRRLLLGDLGGYLALLRRGERDPSMLMDEFDSARILTPMREGALGVDDLNREIEEELENLDLKHQLTSFYHGRPILILRNDYNLQLYNGDVGICIENDDSEHPMVAFADADGGTRLLLASRLPPHETCFAMTVHKAQGSEFEHVTLILPNHAPPAAEQLLSRELVYTAITRARSKVRLYASADTWRR